MPHLFGAYGRVNLIGEHTDFNGGFVLPAALDRETVVAAVKREDRIIRVRSLNLSKGEEIDLDAPQQKLRGSWLDYVEGVARVLEQRGHTLNGADLLILSDVPSGAGLSSSAALEVSVGLALSEMSGHKIERKELALIGQQAEHEFVGAKVGIMDQFVAALGRPGQALLIDCRDLTSEAVSFDTERAVIVICNTGVKHSLASSEYNVRRHECEEGVRLLREFMPGIEYLRDVSSADLALYGNKLPEVIRKRVRHIVTENERTLKAAKVLADSDFEKFGEYMRQSHSSLRDDFEVSCDELNVMAEIAGTLPGVYGARMTGGGFGGSTVNLVGRENVDEFTARILPEYEKRTGREGTIYIVDPSHDA